MASRVDADSTEMDHHSDARLSESQLLSYWSRRYEPQPSGELCVADILQLTLLFVPPDPEALLSLSLVCRAWKSRADYLPQWQLVTCHAPRTAPSQWLEEAYPPDFPRIQVALLRVTVVAAGGAVPLLAADVSAEHPPPIVTSRAEYIRECATLREWQVEGRRQTTVRRGCDWFKAFVALGVLVAVLPLTLLYADWSAARDAANGDGNDPTLVSFASGFSSFSGYWLAYWLPSVGRTPCLRQISLGLVESRTKQAARVMLIVGLAVWLVGAVPYAIVQVQKDFLEKMAATQYFNASSCPPDYEGYDSPYFLSIGEADKAMWFLDPSEEPSSLSPSNPLVQVRFLHLNASVCSKAQIDDGIALAVRIGVVVPPSGLSVDWWASVRGHAPGAELVFRTTRWQPFFPLPWYLYPAQPWSRVVPDLWVPGNVPVIGAQLASEEDLPFQRISSYHRAATVLAVLAFTVYTLSALSVFSNSRTVVWVAVAFSCVIANPLVMAFFGGLCYFSSSSMCLVSRTDALYLLGFGAAGSVLLTVALVVRRACR